MALFSFPALSLAQTTGAVRGQITDSVTRFGIEGAQLTLDLLPGDGTAEFTTVSDPFGMFAVTAAAAGGYRLRATHPGYVAFETNIVVTAGSTLPQRITLTPLAGGSGRFDITAEVRDASTSLQLGGVRVVVERFNGAGDATPAESVSDVTDANGYVAFRGMASGFYRFRANDPGFGTSTRPGWKKFSSENSPDDKKFLGSAHAADIKLKPIPQSVIVRVLGIDVASTNAITVTNLPLAGFTVEVTGVDPADSTAELLPTQSSVTDKKGECVFTGLTAISLRIQTKRLGYQSLVRVVQPDPLTEQFPAVVVMYVVLLPTHLDLHMLHSYTDARFMYGINVHLEGMTNSSSEGVVRDLNLWDFRVPDQRIFVSLLPGRYHVSVNGASGISPITTVRPHFVGEEIVDVIEGLTTRADLRVEALPATVEGYLQVAEQASDEPLNAATLPTPRPIYQALQRSDVEFVEFSTDGYLQATQRVVRVSTDASGFFRARLPAARYGIRIPGMAGYFGHSMRLRNLTPNAITAERDVEQGWPHSMPWPFAGNPPDNGTGRAGNQFLLRSNHDYRMELRAWKSIVTLYGMVEIKQGAYFHSLIEGGKAILRSTTGLSRETPIFEVSFRYYYLFADVPPGTYTVALQDPKYTFTFNQGGGTNSTAIVIPAPTAPGVPPATAQLDPLPFSVLEAHATANYQQRRMKLTVLDHRTEFGGGTYAPPIEVITSLAYIKPQGYDYWVGTPLGGAIPDRALIDVPDVPFDLWFRVARLPPRTERQFQTNNISPDRPSLTYEFYTFGPMDSVSNQAPDLMLQRTFRWVIRSVNDAAPDELVPNTTVSASGFNAAGNQQVMSLDLGAGERIEENWIGRPNIISVSNAFWTAATPLEQTTSTNPAVNLPTYVTHVHLRRGIRVAGTVRADISGRPPIAGARVRILNRYSGRLDELTTSTNGTFGRAQNLTSEPFFVEVEVPGHLPWRKRYASADAVFTSLGNATITTDALLQRLPPPTIESLTLDRKGMFLTGITKSGDQVLRPENALKALTMTWNARIVPATVSYTLPPFDQPDGTPGALKTYTFEDPIAQCFLVDPRAHLGNRLNGLAIPLSLPASNAPPDLVARWLSELQMGVSSNALDGGTLRNVFHRPASLPLPPLSPGVLTATGQIHIGYVPQDEFRPVIFAVSDRGAIAMRSDFYPTNVPPALDGVRLPRWMGAASDIISTIAGIPASTGVSLSPEALARRVPRGSFVPLPSFKFTIEEEAGFLDYDYELGVTWIEGARSTREGFLDIGPSALGLEFSGEANFGLKGPEHRLFFGVRSTATKSLDFNRMLPRHLTNRVAVSGEFTVGASTKSSALYDPNDRTQFELVTTIDGTFTFEGEADLQPLLGKLPAVGPVLTALHKTEALRLYGVLEGGAGLKSTRTFRTAYPPPRPESSVPGQLDQTYRRHFLGGQEEFTGPVLTDKQRFDLCFRLGGGLSAKIGEFAGAKGLLVLQGEECVPGFGALEITPNLFGDWPYVARAKGSIDITLEAFLDVWVLRYQKDWTWSLWPIDYDIDRTTPRAASLHAPGATDPEPTFKLSSVNITNKIIGPATALASKFDGAGRKLLDDFFAPGSFRLARGSSGGQGLVFTDIAVGSGMMTLKFAARSAGGAFGSPVEIARAAGLVSADVSQLPNGDWLAVWTELAVADMGNPFPPSRVLFARGTANGTSWSAPTVLAVLPDVAFDLRLVTTDALTGLAYLHTEQGPSAQIASLALSTFNGSVWNAPSNLVANVEYRAWDTAANSAKDPEALIGLLDGTGLLRSWSWTPTSVSNPRTIATDAGSVFAFASDASGNYAAAWEHAGGGIALSRFDGTSAWTPLGTIADVLPVELDLTSVTANGSNLWLTAWAAGGNPLNLHYAFADAAGQVIKGPVALTSNSTGQYSGLELQWDQGGVASLLAKHEATNTAVENFKIDFAASTAFGPRLTSARLTADGRIEFFIQGDSTQRFRVQVSTDLQTWTDVATGIAPSDTTPFRDLIGSNAYRYYRAVTP